MIDHLSTAQRTRERKKRIHGTACMMIVDPPLGLQP